MASNQEFPDSWILRCTWEWDSKRQIQQPLHVSVHQHNICQHNRNFTWAETTMKTVQDIYTVPTPVGSYSCIGKKKGHMSIQWIWCMFYSIYSTFVINIIHFLKILSRFFLKQINCYSYIIKYVTTLMTIWWLWNSAFCVEMNGKILKLVEEIIFFKHLRWDVYVNLERSPVSINMKTQNKIRN